MGLLQWKKTGERNPLTKIHISMCRKKGICHFYLFRPPFETTLCHFFLRHVQSPFLPIPFHGKVNPAKLTNQNFGASRPNSKLQRFGRENHCRSAPCSQCFKSSLRSSVIVAVPYMRTPLATTWSGSKSSLNRSPRFGVTGWVCQILCITVFWRAPP